MRKISLLKKLALGISLLLCATAMSAKCVYVSADGDWANDGLTFQTPVPFLQQTVNNLVEDGDVIVVLGNIAMTSNIEIINKSIMITGSVDIMRPNDESKASTLDGGGFEISGEGNVTIANLVFKNAPDKAILIDGEDGPLNVKIGYCIFRNNSSAVPGQDGGQDNGAGVNVKGGASAKISSCWFFGNQGFRGGALFVDGSFVEVEYSNFEGNFTNAALSEANSRGGAIACAGTGYTLDFNFCIFKGNYSRRGGGCIFEYGRDGELTFKNCLLTGNYSGRDWFMQAEFDDEGALINTPTAPGDNHGGLIKSDGNSAITFINCTVYGNNAWDDAVGGAFLISGGEFNMINCTVTGNMTNGNQDHTGGMVFENNANVKIFNSIIAGNKAAGGSYWSDFAGNSETATYEIKNSIIGAYRNAVTADMDEVSRPHAGNSGGQTPDDLNYNDGINDDFNPGCLGNFWVSAVPLLACAEKIGNIAHLNGIDNDITGKTIVPDNGKIYAGSVQFAGTQDAAENYIGTFKVPSEKPAMFINSDCKVSGIYDVADDGAVAVAYYNLLGQKLNEEPASGMFIVKYSNGKTVKVLKK